MLKPADESVSRARKDTMIIRNKNKGMGLLMLLLSGSGFLFDCGKPNKVAHVV